MFLCKFRCANHETLFEEGIFIGVDRAKRTCRLCNTNVLGDEFHYILQCSFFEEDSRKYILLYYFTHTSFHNFSELIYTNDYSLLVQ